MLLTCQHVRVLLKSMPRRAASSSARALGGSDTARVLDKGVWKEQKMCAICERPFTWRKKWERCWDEVTTCSKSCNAERRRLTRVATRDAAGENAPPVACEGDGVARPPLASPAADLAAAAVPPPLAPPLPAPPLPASVAKKAARKAAKAEAKAARRALRQGEAPASHGRKPCGLCARAVDLLVRCQLDSSGDWRMVCGRCWKLPSVANGVPDGDGTNPHYRYGGLWKNLHAPLRAPALPLADTQVQYAPEPEVATVENA